MLLEDTGICQTSDERGNLPKQRVNRRKLESSKSFLQNMFQPKSSAVSTNAGETNESFDDDCNDPKTKNIRQTELIIDLRNAIAQIVQHFANCQEKHEAKIIVNQVSKSE